MFAALPKACIKGRLQRSEMNEKEILFKTERYKQSLKVFILHHSIILSHFTYSIREKTTVFSKIAQINPLTELDNDLS